MTPEEHDRALALTSHLPHLARVGARRSPAAGATGSDSDGLSRHDPCGGRRPGPVECRDLRSRTARHVLEASLALLARRLERFAAALAAGRSEALDALLGQAKGIRDALGS